jgi:hypothetical protein
VALVAPAEMTHGHVVVEVAMVVALKVILMLLQTKH